MGDINQHVSNLIMSSINSLYPQFDTNQLTIHESKQSDYQFNQVNVISKRMKLENTIVADGICEKIKFLKEITQVKWIKVSSGQIIITFNLSNEYLESEIIKLYQTDILPCPIMDLSQKILIDFSSPNIAKEMHVGHLRSTIIGDCLCRLFEYCGCNVQKINHIGDWGTQFGMLIAYIKKNQIQDYDINDLMNLYKESKKLFDNDPHFKKQSQLETVILQKGDHQNRKMWQNICDISMNAFNKIYQKLNIKLETRGESYYQDLMDKLVTELQPILIDADGMKVLFAKNFNLPYIIVKSDGGYTYDTSDLAAIKHRIFTEKIDQIIYVVDSGQSTHMNILFQLTKDLGWTNITKLNHVGFGLVLGQDNKKLKSRSGNAPKLKTLLNLACKHTYCITTNMAIEKHPDWNEDIIKEVSTKIAINCIKYADLSNPRLNNYKFNLEKMCSVKGNTAVYLMYAMARCRTILKKIPNLDNIKKGNLLLDTETSSKLALKILQYPVRIKNALNELAPHHLCNYLYEMVGLLAKFYEKNRCLEFDVNNKIVQIHEHRVRLIILSEKILSLFFHLIGLSCVDQI